MIICRAASASMRLSSGTTSPRTSDAIPPSGRIARVWSSLWATISDSAVDFAVTVCRFDPQSSSMEQSELPPVRNAHQPDVERPVT